MIYFKGMLYIGLFIITFPINTSDKMKADGSRSAGKFKIFVSYQKINETKQLEREILSISVIY